MILSAQNLTVTSNNNSNQFFNGVNGDISDTKLSLPAIKADSLVLELSSFGETNQVFKCLQLNVPRGSIFGLIGPSGCGKTTFFRTILGRYKVNSGNLQVLGVNITTKHQLGSDIGYMPQDIALDKDLTVHETLYFYGCLNNLSSKIIETRSQKFRTVLGFDNFSLLVGQLSIGQQRRLSLVCALLHQPKLALLDEPTVGSDPLLVKKIWDYLKIAKTEWQMTIVVSTHYLEEVRKADYFAFLAKGYVLFEDSPDHFISTSGHLNLEEAISYKYKIEINNRVKKLTGQVNSELVKRTGQSISSDNSSTFYGHKTSTNRRYNWTFFHKYIWLLWRYHHIWMKHMIYRLVGVGLVHAMIITFCGLLYGHFPRDLSIGLINHDSGSSAIKYINLLQTNPNQWSFPLYDNEMKAHHDTELGKLQGYLSIGSTFTSNLDQLISMGLDEDIDESLLSTGHLTLTQDTVNRLKADSVELTTYLYIYRLINQASSSSNQSNVTQPTKLDFIKIEPLFEYEDRLKDLAPTNIVLVKFFFQLVETVTVGMIVLWVTREYHEPTIERLFASGVTRLELTCALITITVILLSPILITSCAILTLTTGFPINGAWPFVASVVPAIIIAGCAKAIWVGSMIPSTTLAILVTTSYGFTGIFTGSIFWPLESLPYFMKPIRTLYPYTESGLSAVRAMIYGDNFFTPQVFSGLLYAWSQAFATLLMVIMWFIWSNHNGS